MSKPSHVAQLHYMRVVRALKLPAPVANPLALYRALCRQPLHAPGFPLVLLYSAKAGSGALIKWFLFQTGQLQDPADARHGVHLRQKEMVGGRPGYRRESLRLILRHEKPIFKLVRNPRDRAVSSFLAMLDHAREGAGSPWGIAPLAAARRMSGKPTPDAAALSFRDFVRYLAKTSTERGAITAHIARQHLPGEDRRVDRILKLERFAEEVGRIESEFGLTPSPAEVVAKPHNPQSRPQMDEYQEHGITDREFTANDVREGRFPPYGAFYDEETRQLVRQCFAADFEAYGY